MKNLYTIFLLTAGVLFFSANLKAQGFCGTVEQVTASGPGKFAISVSLSGTAAFEMGSSNLVLSFNNAGLDNPVLISSPAQSPPFNTVNVTEPFDPGTNAFVLSINNVYAFDGTPGFGFGVGLTNTEFAIIEFDILDINETSGINWLYNGGATLTVVNISDASQIFADDVACLLPLLVSLPVELTSFNVNKKGDQNALVTWQTASEVNTSHFDVERSLDNGRTWEKVGMQSAQGFSTDVNNYEFEDKNLKRFIDQNQLVYYRLKSVDFDLSHQFSQTKNIAIEIETVSIAIYPNPTVEGVHVTVHSKDKREELTAVLKDLTGRTIFARNLGNAKMINEYVNFKNLASGTYFMTVQSDNRVFSTEKLIILEK